MFVNGPAKRNAFSRQVRQVYLSASYDACRHVKEDGTLSSAGQAHGKRIRAKERPEASGGRHVGWRVRQCYTHHVSSDRLLHEERCETEVRAIAHTNHAHSMLARKVDGGLHRRVTDNLSEPSIPVQQSRGTSLLNHTYPGARVNGPIP
jgi:hypothetical protein